MNKPRFQFKTQTVDDAPLLVSSIPVPINSGLFLFVEYSALKSTKDMVIGGHTVANFYRAEGDVTRTAENRNQGLNEASTGNFPDGQPYVDAVANTGTESVDIQAIGQTDTTIDWIVKYHYILQ